MALLPRTSITASLPQTEEQFKAIEASVVSLKDFDPSKAKDSEKVVELIDHRSITVGDLAKSDDADIPDSIKADAQTVVDNQDNPVLTTKAEVKTDNKPVPAPPVSN